MDAPIKPATNYLIPTGEDDVARMHAFNAIFDVASMQWIEADRIDHGIQFLDVGCGPGELTIKIARALGEKSTVVGVDCSAEQLEVARKNAARAGVRNVRWIQKDIYDLSAYADQFDVVHCRFILCHLTDAAAAVKQLAGAVTKQGLLIMEEMTSNAPECVPSEPFSVRAWKGLVDVQHYIQGSNMEVGLALEDLVRQLGMTHIQIERPNPVASTSEQKGILPLVAQAAKSRLPDFTHGLIELWSEALTEIQNDATYSITFSNFIQIKAVKVK